ncbi:hypothetical protein SEA_TILLUMS_30 [Arthrobacter phage Tillums]|nr:hypothetical protein SEA_TILLUMS_30 [Arthrobacter phage Tillums]
MYTVYERNSASITEIATDLSTRHDAQCIIDEMLQMSNGKYTGKSYYLKESK